MVKMLSTNLNKVVLAGEVAQKIKQLTELFSVVFVQVKIFDQFRKFPVLVDNDMFEKQELAEGSRVELIGKMQFIEGKIFVLVEKINKFFIYKNKVEFVGTLHSVENKNIKLIHTGSGNKSVYIDTNVFVNYDNPIVIKKAQKEPHRPLHASGRLSHNSYADDNIALTEGYVINTLSLKQL